MLHRSPSITCKTAAQSAADTLNTWTKGVGGRREEALIKWFAKHPWKLLLVVSTKRWIKTLRAIGVIDIAVKTSWGDFNGWNYRGHILILPPLMISNFSRSSTLFHFPIYILIWLCISLSEVGYSFIPFAPNFLHDPILGALKRCGRRKNWGVRSSEGKFTTLFLHYWELPDRGALVEQWSGWRKTI